MRTQLARLAGLTVLAVAVAVVAALKPRPGGEFASAAGHFRAKFPDPPRESSQQARGVTVTTFAASGRDGTCKVLVAEVPTAGVPAEVIQRQLDQSVKNCEWPVTEARPVTLAGRHPGRDFWADFPGPPRGKVHGRYYVVGRRFFQVLVVGTEAFVNGPEAREFLDSFDADP